MDKESADLILSLQAQDLAELHRSDKTDNGNSSINDSTLALELYEQELRLAAFSIRDHAYGEKVGVANNNDSGPPSPVISPTPDFDQTCATLLKSLAIHVGSSSDSESWVDLSSSEETHESLSGADISKEKDPEAALSGCSLNPDVQESETEVFTYSCVACDICEKENEMVQAPCGDRYCKECIVNLFTISIKDEARFPPRCCRQPVPIDLVSTILDPELRQSFEKTAVEFTATDRTYCSRSTCSTFLPSASKESERAECLGCHQMTCTICKNAAHDGDCPASPQHQALMELAYREGWKKCYQCKRLVELNTGCNHMT